MAAFIFWPPRFLPGNTDNYTSNEVIVKGLSASSIWPLLADISKWESYYSNVSQITPPASGPQLKQGDTFVFSTFGLPPIQTEVLESVPPSPGQPARLAWLACLDDGDKTTSLDVYHAWLIEDLDQDRVRILTQESQIGRPAVELSRQRPNPILNGHQDWLIGLVAAARKKSRDSE